jgi:hypothetical protein
MTHTRRRPREFPEIRARSKLKHPNILPIIDFGRCEHALSRAFRMSPSWRRTQFVRTYALVRALFMAFMLSTFMPHPGAATSKDRNPPGKDRNHKPACCGLLRLAATRVGFCVERT